MENLKFSTKDISNHGDQEYRNDNKKWAISHA